MAATRRSIPSLIAQRKAFKGNSVSAQVNPDWVDTGRLAAEWRSRLREDSNAGLAYVVFSYATPIAWVTLDGTVVVPDTKYSPTTSNHQGLVRQGGLVSDVKPTCVDCDEHEVGPGRVHKNTRTCVLCYEARLGVTS